MDELLVIAEEPAQLPEPLEYPERKPCPFCGGSGHIQTMNLWERRYEYPQFHRKVRKKAYVFCGRCKARGPIVVKTLVNYTYRDVQEMEIEAVKLWNQPFVEVFTP